MVKEEYSLMMLLSSIEVRTVYLVAVTYNNQKPNV